MDVDQEPHKLGNADGGVRVVELDGHLVGKARNIAFLLEMPANEILQRSGREKVFLPQAQLFASRGDVARIENLRDRFRANLVGVGADIVALVEYIETKRIGRTSTGAVPSVCALSSRNSRRSCVQATSNSSARSPVSLAAR
jgi:hypothetical protein